MGSEISRPHIRFGGAADGVPRRDDHPDAS
jgi:hypothetical protein